MVGDPHSWLCVSYSLSGSISVGTSRLLSFAGEKKTYSVLCRKQSFQNIPMACSTTNPAMVHTAGEYAKHVSATENITAADAHRQASLPTLLVLQQTYPNLFISPSTIFISRVQRTAL